VEITPLVVGSLDSQAFWAEPSLPGFRELQTRHSRRSRTSGLFLLVGPPGKMVMHTALRASQLPAADFAVPAAIDVLHSRSGGGRGLGTAPNVPTRGQETRGAGKSAAPARGKVARSPAQFICRSGGRFVSAHRRGRAFPSIR